MRDTVPIFHNRSIQENIRNSKELKPKDFQSKLKEKITHYKGS